MNIAFQVGLVAHLTADAAIAALVDDRIHPVQGRQGEKRTSILYRLAGGSTTRAMGAAPTGGAKVSEPFVELEAWAKTYLEAHQLNTAIAAALDGIVTTWSVTISGTTYTVAVRKSHRGEPFDLASEDGMFGVRCTYSMAYYLT